MTVNVWITGANPQIAEDGGSATVTLHRDDTTDDLTVDLTYNTVIEVDSHEDLLVEAPKPGGGVEINPSQVVMPAGQASLTLTVRGLDDDVDESTLEHGGIYVGYPAD